MMQPNWIDRLPTPARRAMEAAMIQRCYSKGALLYGRLETPPGLFVIRSGSALACLDSANGRRLLLKIFRRNELLGEIVAFDGMTANISAEARTELSVSMIPARTFFALKNEHPEIEAALGRVSNYLLRAMFDVVIEQALLPIEQRVVSRLALLCRFEGESTSEPGTYLLEQSQAELALMLGTSRQSVNAVLSQLEATGAITRKFCAIECRPAMLPAIH